MSALIKTFLVPTLISIFVLIAIFIWGGWTAFILAVLLTILEVTLSFDNAVINAKILKQMDEKWQKRFLTWGILVAGFGARLSPRALAAFEGQFSNGRLEPAIRTVLGQALGPARYTPDPGPHFGLGAPLYLHFTSPIRRYADLVVHRIIKRYLEGHREYDELRAELAVLAADCDRSSFAAGKAESERYRMLVARLYAGKLGEEVFGNIVALKPFGLVVQIAGTGATGSIAMESLPGGPFRTDISAQALIGPGTRFAVGDRVSATVSSVNEELGRIDLVPITAT